MRRSSPAMKAAWLMLLCSFLPASLGCNRDVAGELATLSGAYLGDVVSTIVTSYLHDALGIEDGGSTYEHSHDAEPLHDHEH